MKGSHKKKFSAHSENLIGIVNYAWSNQARIFSRSKRGSQDTFFKHPIGSEDWGLGRTTVNA